MRSPAPRPSQLRWSFSGNILGSKLCIGVTIRPNFFRFSLFCIAFGSVLFVILFFLISSYSSLLIILFLPLLILLVGAMLRLLFISSYILNCIMICPPFWGVFRGGQALFDPFGVKTNVYGATILSNFFYFILFNVFDIFFLLLSSYSSLHISRLIPLFLFLLFNILPLLIILFLYLNCLLYWKEAY